MIYFDNAATTRVSDTAAQAALTAMTELYANPSSAHAFGFEAEKALRAARAAVLAALGFTPSEGSLVFTGSGSEADNLALRGAAHALARRGKHIVLSDSEHPAVENTAKDLEKEGFSVSRISTEGGKLDLDEARAVLTPDTILVSCMAVNNETGAIYDIPSLASLVKALCPHALFHTDAVQAFTKIPAGAWKKADLVSISAHKIHAPKGVGALFVRKGVRLVPCITGGGQENGLRSGTEAMPGICAMAAAAKEATADFAALDTQVKQINTYLRERLCLLDGVCINTEPDGFLPHILSIAVPGLRSEILLRFLSERGIYVSAGSACSAKHADNRVLSAFGLPDKIADSTLRLSFSADNTTAECDVFVKALSDAMQTLIHT
ncbi:MAG: cysteine desulfurase family protein [Eubacteriales bacterium]|jgi:cysteine desulfurase